jgi:hypothetical protein
MEHAAHAHSSHCLNCGNSLTTPFCGECGQTAHTHRFSLKHFFTHDLVHGLFHVDRGFFYTLTMLFTQPGKSVRGYINGKRVSYFNYFTLLILVVTVGHLLGSFSTVKIQHLMDANMQRFASELDKIASTYPKAFAMSTIPVYALFSSLFYKKSRMNYSEHLVLNTYKVSAELVIGFLFTILTIFYTNITVLKPLYSVVALLSLVYSTWFYYQCFNDDVYTKKGRLVRSVVASLSVMLFSGFISAFLIGIKLGFQDRQ